MHALRGCSARWTLKAQPCARAVPSNASTSSVQEGHPAQAPTQATPPKPAATGLEQKFQNSFTMSQVYVKDRPPPIPLSDFESRRRTRDLEEICSAGKKRGVSAEVVRANMAQIDMLMPGLVNLHKAKAADWLLILLDVNQFMSKLILLRELFPAANLQKVLSAQPKLLLKTTDQLRDDGKQVRAMLSAAPEPDAIIEAVPDLMNPLSLARSLNHLQTVFKGCDPVAMLVKNPTILLNMGEADIADSAEYGELSTKD